MTDTRIDTDADNIIIIGAGLAGLYAGLILAPKPVTILSPRSLGYGASSAWAQGGVAAAMDRFDTPQAHALDTINAGDGLVDPDVAHFVTSAAKEHVMELIDVGTPFDRQKNGRFILSKEAAHSFARVVRVKGDQAGKAIISTLIKQVQKTPSIKIIEGASALEFISDGKQVSGVIVSLNGQAPQVMQGSAYLLAAGGIGSLYAKTTNPPDVCGLAVGMAARAGAVISDAEFIQFHPTAIDINLDPTPLATEALRGEGAILLNNKGQRFMCDIHPDAELASRDIVARAIFHQYQIGNQPVLDTRSAIGKAIFTDFPVVSKICVEAGIDPLTQPIPVIPAAHYHMGGVKSDIRGRSGLDNLWVAGEASSTGLHGANRLASNGLLEALVFAAVAAHDIMNSIKIKKDNVLLDIKVDKMPSILPAPPNAVQKLRQVMSDYVGVIRNGDDLAKALVLFDDMDQHYGGKSVYFDNMLVAATIITAAAYWRQETRGGHYRLDFPEKDEAFEKRSNYTYAMAYDLRRALKEKL